MGEWKGLNRCLSIYAPIGLEKNMFKKKDEKTLNAGRKGGLKTQEIHPETKKYLELGRRGQTFKKFNSNVEHQRNAGRMSRVWEQKVADMLTREFDRVYLPQCICDRICIKDGKITFIEIKKIKHIDFKKPKDLTPLQEEFKNFCNKYGYAHEVIEVIDPIKFIIEHRNI